MGGVEADLVTVDVDANEDLAREYEASFSVSWWGAYLEFALFWVQVRAMPTVIAF